MRKLVYLLMLGILCTLSTQALATVYTYNMGAGDSLGNSSFNTAGQWVAANGGTALLPASGAPNDTNVYYTGGNLLRGPASGSAYTFAGDVLRIGYSSTGTLTTAFTSGGAANNDCLIFKVAGQSLTIPNLVLDAGVVRDGLGTSQTCSLNGNLYVTANGGGFNAQCYSSINSVISGPGPIYVGDNGSGEAGRTLIFTSPLSTYAGNIIMAPASGADATRSRLQFAAGSIMNFTIGASGVNNKISGTGTVTYDGAFNINLTAASTNLGDSWVLSSPTAPVYDATFSINGFTNAGSGYWLADANSTTYEYNTANGTLTVVPEPATIVMVLTGLVGIGLMWFRKK